MAPADVPISARSDGYIFFEFDKSEDYAEDKSSTPYLNDKELSSKEFHTIQTVRREIVYKRIEYMNALLFLIYSAHAEITKKRYILQEPINPLTLIHCERNGAQLNPLPTPTIHTSRAHPFKSASEATPIAMEALDIGLKGIRSLHKVMGKDFAATVNLIYLANHQYTQHQFSSSHLLAWSVSEKLLNLMWEQLLLELDLTNGGHTKINKDRRKTLNSRDFSASVISQTLSLQKKLDDNELSRIDSTRRKRNSFIHGLSMITQEDTSAAIYLACHLLEKFTQTPVKPTLWLAYIDIFQSD